MSILQSLKHSEGDSTSINSLIVNDFYCKLVNVNIVKGQKDEPMTIQTYLGNFILSGVLMTQLLTEKVQLF